MWGARAGAPSTVQQQRPRQCVKGVAGMRAVEGGEAHNHMPRISVPPKSPLVWQTALCPLQPPRSRCVTENVRLRNVHSSPRAHARPVDRTALHSGPGCHAVPRGVVLLRGGLGQAG